MKKQIIVKVDEKTRKFFKIQCSLMGTTMTKRIVEFMRSEVAKGAPETPELDEFMEKMRT